MDYTSGILDGSQSLGVTSEAETITRKKTMGTRLRSVHREIWMDSLGTE